MLTPPPPRRYDPIRVTLLVETVLGCAPLPPTLCPPSFGVIPISMYPLTVHKGQLNHHLRIGYKVVYCGDLATPLVDGQTSWVYSGTLVQYPPKKTRVFRKLFGFSNSSQ